MTCVVISVTALALLPGGKPLNECRLVSVDGRTDTTTSGQVCEQLYQLEQILRELTDA
jgi:hypothetical protein